jgi:hypothetical protein
MGDEGKAVGQHRRLCCVNSAFFAQSGMVTRLPQGVLDRLFDASLVTIMGMPPKDPHDDDDENEDDEEDDEEEDEEPAVIREPDEC